MYELKNGKLVTTFDKPFESAGYIYYFKKNDGSTHVVLFERFNEKKNRNEFEIGTFGKSDFGIVTKEEGTKAKFVNHTQTSGQEGPLATSLREGSEETNGIINTAPANATSYDVVTKAHKCWCDEEREIETTISVVPYELNEEQFLALTQKSDYSLFTRVVSAELKPGKDGKFELNLDSVNLLAADNLKEKWRTFTKITLTDPAFTDCMNQVFTKMVKPKVADCVQSSNPYSSWNASGQTNAPAAEIAPQAATNAM